MIFFFSGGLLSLALAVIFIWAAFLISPILGMILLGFGFLCGMAALGGMKNERGEWLD